MNGRGRKEDFFRHLKGAFGQMRSVVLRPNSLSLPFWTHAMQAISSPLSQPPPLLMFFHDHSFLVLLPLSELLKQAILVLEDLSVTSWNNDLKTLTVLFAGAGLRSLYCLPYLKCNRSYYFFNVYKKMSRGWAIKDTSTKSFKTDMVAPCILFCHPLETLGLLSIHLLITWQFQ